MYKKIILWCICIFCIFSPVLLFIPVQHALVFQYENSGTVLAYIPISEGDTFSLKYTHSIHLSDVEDLYVVTNERHIRQYEMIFEEFAIGMPENASDGERFVRENGKYHIKNMNRIFPFFDLRTGKIRANHILIFKGEEYPISGFIQPGTWVRIQIKPIHLWHKWKGVNILEGTI